MATAWAGCDHDHSRNMASPSADLRSLDAATVCAMWARRLLETGDLTVSERQNLRDICRQHRQLSTNRSTFATLLELSPRATRPIDALWGLELGRMGILGRSDYRLPCAEHAHVIEEATNHDGNLAQLEHIQRPTRSSLERLVHTMAAQELASRDLKDAEIGAMRGR